MPVVSEYTDATLMPFGKFKGTALANVDSSYLLWLWDTSEQGKRLSDAKLAKYISENVEALKMEVLSEKQQKRYEKR